MSANGEIDLSVIIVNYNVAPLVMQVVASLRRQKFAGQDGNEGRLEILVIDNASSPEDRVYLERLPSSVVLLRNDRNVGFAAANNQGIKRASGRYLCFLNPDAMVLDGALEVLLQHLSRHPEVGAVGPKIWADDERTLLLPPGDPPTLSFILAQLLGGAFPAVGRWHGRQWCRRALAFWSSHEPVRVPMLSGACILTSRTTLDQVGGFDSRYFLYYEDTDWCRRLRRAGYHLVVVPAAEIVHYYNQSAKLDPNAAGRALLSQARFVEVHFGVWGRLLYEAAKAVNNRANRRRCPIMRPQAIELGCLQVPPRLCVSGVVSSREPLIQISQDWSFVPSAAVVVRTADFRFPPSVWDRMQPGRYYARMINPQSLRVLAIWSWEKG